MTQIDQEFMKTASPTEIFNRYPRDYTLVWRMGSYKWHLSAVPRTNLEKQMYDLASQINEFNEFSETLGTREYADSVPCPEIVNSNDLLMK